MFGMFPLKKNFFFDILPSVTICERGLVERNVSLGNQSTFLDSKSTFRTQLLCNNQFCLQISRKS